MNDASSSELRWRPGPEQDSLEANIGIVSARISQRENDRCCIFFIDNDISKMIDVAVYPIDYCVLEIQAYGEQYGRVLASYFSSEQPIPEKRAHEARKKLQERVWLEQAR